MSLKARTRDRYIVKSLVHSSKVLGAFHSPAEALALKEISARCSLPKTMVFRLLFTMEKMWDGRQGCAKPLQVAGAALETETVPAGISGSGHRLSVLEGGIP
jgi:hypothetical protein